METTTIAEQPKNYFKKQIIVLKFGGVSFTGNESIAYKLYSFLLLFTSIFGYAILDGYELFKHDLDTSAGIIMYESMVLVTVIKATIVLINRIILAKVLAKLEQEPFLPNANRGGDVEEKLIKECTWKINAQTYGYWIGALICIIIASAYGLSTRLRSDDYHDWELGCGPLTVLNMTHSPNYEITWFYQFYATFMSGYYFTTIDLIAAGVLAHISYQFKILQYFLRVLTTRCHEEMLKDQTENRNSADDMISVEQEIDASKIPWKYLKKSIKEAVRYHQAIIDIAKEMEELFRYLLLLSFLISLACLCFELFYAASQKSALGLLRNVMEFMVCAAQIGTICYWGEQVMLESQEVGRAAAESNFVGSDVRFQKALVLIIRRSQTPTKLTAGKFTNICLTTFAWVMRTSYTAFMMMRNIKAKEP